MNQQNYTKTSQNLILENRKKLTISGVKDIYGFSEGLISVLTNLGNLTIRGSQLKINKFSVETGDAYIEGNISSMVYDNMKNKNGVSGSFWAKIIKWGVFWFGCYDN